MPKCLERKATESGMVRARSHKRCGAVVRRSLSRSTVTVIVRSSRAGLPEFYSSIELHIGARVKQRWRSAALPPQRGALAHPVGHQAREFLRNVRHVDIFPALPTRCRIAHAEYGERRPADLKNDDEFTCGESILAHGSDIR